VKKEAMKAIPTDLNCFQAERYADKLARLYGLVLAGGQGKRVKALVRRMRGDALPRRYVNFTGFYSMLEHTYRRLEKLIPTRLYL
jgi:hypothetical protein